jgi:tripartite-type tricarboxylate transporter receptor subunit TctC
MLTLRVEKPFYQRDTLGTPTPVSTLLCQAKNIDPTLDSSVYYFFGKFMKKLLATLFVFLSLAASAKENITIYYSWGAADTAANFHRTLADEANKIQNRYNFVFDVKPGAGGSIAARQVAGQPDTILATASAFFIRPNFFPNESHDISKFRSLFPQCAAPAVISSKKYKTWAEVPTDRPISIGMSGMGTTTHLIAAQIAKKYPNLVIVPFKSTSEAVLSVLSDSTDMAVNFMGDSVQYVETNRLTVLGVTGSRTVNGVKPLSSQGFTRDLDVMDVPAQLLVPTTFPTAKAQEIRDIFVKAGRSTAVLDSYKPDFCQSNNQMADRDIQPWYAKQTADWRRLTQGIELK